MKDKTLFMEGLLLALLAADITNVILANDNGCCESIRMEVDESDINLLLNGKMDLHMDARTNCSNTSQNFFQYSLLITKANRTKQTYSLTTDPFIMSSILAEYQGTITNLLTYHRVCTFQPLYCAMDISFTPRSFEFNGSTIAPRIHTPSCSKTLNTAQPIKFNIQGLLEAPTQVRLEAVNMKSVVVSWSPPFTLEGVPILHYSVYITSQGVSVQRNTTETNITLNRPCASTSYNICAWNAVGKGNTTTYCEDHTMPEATVKAITELSQQGVCMSCTFFADSPAEGCGIELQNEQFTFIFNSTRLSERDLVLLQCFSVPQAGEYGVYMYEIQSLGRLELSKRKLNNNIVIYKTELVLPLQAVVRPVNMGICVSCYSTIAEGCALKLKDNINTYVFDVLTSRTESLKMQCFSVPTAGVFSVFVYEVWGNGSLSERALVLPNVSLSLDTQSQDNVHCYSISVVSGFVSVLSVTVFALFVVVSIAIASILRSRIRQNKGDKEVQQNVDGEPFYDVVGTTDSKTTKIELNANAAYGKPHTLT